MSASTGCARATRSAATCAPTRRLERARDPRHQREPVARIADRVREDVGRLERPEVAQQQHPRVERARHARRQRPGAGDRARGRAEGLDRRRRRRRPLAADHPRRAVPQQDRQIAARPVHVRLDDLQRQPGRHGGVERVAAALQNRHPGRRGEPVRRGHHAEGSAQLWAGRESHPPRNASLARPTWRSSSTARRSPKRCATRCARRSRRGSRPGTSRPGSRRSWSATIPRPRSTSAASRRRAPRPGSAASTTAWEPTRRTTRSARCCTSSTTTRRSTASCSSSRPRRRSTARR